MAIISNINDLFSVDSTGAIEFNEQVGTSGYSLESRGAGAPPVWTDRDTGKVTGSGTLNKVARWTATGSDIGDGPITFSGATTTANSTFGGDIALDSPKAIKWNGGSSTNMFIGRNLIKFNVPAGLSQIYVDTDSSLIMSTENGSDSLLIDIDGNVGIAPNTATGLPAYKLDVGGTIRANGNVIALDAEFTNEVTIKQTSASAGFSGKLFIEGTDVPKIQLKNLDQQTSIDQILGTLEFYGSDASTGNAAGVRASITANTGFVSGGTTARDQGCLEFATYNGSDFSGAPRQHLKITPDGGFSFGLTSTAYGTSGQVLTSAGDAPPTWTTPTTGTVKGTGTATRVAFWSASDTITSDADLYWDNTNKRLGIGVSSPAALLEINGTGDAIRVESTNTGAGGAQIDLLHYSTSPADDDTMAYINMGGYYNTTPSQAYFSSIRTVATDISARQGELTFWTVNTTLQQRMVIDTDGNVGIGATAVTEPGFWYDATNKYLAISHWATPPTPAALLHLSDTNNDIDVPQIRIEGRENPGDTKLDISVKDPDVRFNLIENTPDANAGFGLMIFKTNAVAQASFPARGGFNFQTPASSSSLFITNEANVGIGASDPVKILDVRGQLAISNSASSYWYMDRNDATGNFDLNIDTNVTLFSVSQSGLGSFVNTSIGDKLLLAGDDAASARGLMFNCSTTTNQGDTWDIDAQSSTGIIKFSTGSSEKLRIQNSAQSLRVKGGAVTGSNYMQFVNSAGTAQGYFGYGGASNLLYIVQQVAGDIAFYTNSAVRGSISQGGTLTMGGDVVAYGSPSDKRLKENIKPIESALDKVSKLQGVTFDWKDKEKEYDQFGKPHKLQEWKNDIGFIAQDVQKVVPELVRENENGMLSMRHQGIAPILLEAIKELKAEIEELKLNKCNCNCNK